MLERQGIVMKKLRRLYREEKLQVRKRGGRKRALGIRRPMVLLVALMNGEAWTLCQTPSQTVAGSGFWRSSLICIQGA